MRKLVLGTIAVAAAISLNAATLATVNGQSVTDEDVAFLLRNIAPGAEYKDLKSEEKQQILDQTIDRKLLMDHALKSGIEKDSEFIEAINNIKKEVALELWMKKEFDKIKISDAKIKDFYDKNSDGLMHPERVKVRHILLDSADEASKLIKELSGLKGEKLADKFSDLARKNSKDATGQNGGEIGWMPKNHMTENPIVKPFFDEAFTLKKGEVSSKPVQTESGFHVIFVEDKQAPKKADYSEVKEEIESLLKRQEAQEAIATQIKTIREKAKIEVKR